MILILVRGIARHLRTVYAGLIGLSAYAAVEETVAFFLEELDSNGLFVVAEKAL